MKTPLYNTAHPLAESGKPIFIPFGEWNYDGQHRQRLDRAHGEKIANELNARVAKGEPGIPVYQGHPDVPALAAKYPDKGALGWITKIELVNESPDGRAVPGLALTVEWDRDPGRGFRWFSPYWLANSREGSTYIVDEIASIGLVNNPNIPEFRLANSVDANGREHVDAGVPEGGQFAPKAGEWDAKGRKLFAETVVKYAKWKNLDHRNRRDLTMIANDLLKNGREKYSLSSRYLRKSKSEAKRGDEMHSFYGPQKFSDEKRDLWTSMKELHRYAILHGLTYNHKTHQYEESHDRLANEANFDESKHPRASDGKWTSGGGSGGTDSGKKEGRSAGGLKTVIEQRDETEDLFNRSVNTGDEFSVGGTYNPFQTVTDSAFNALKSRANIDDDDMDEPVIRSIVTAIAVSSARDALKLKSKSPAGYAIAIAHVRANEAAKLLNKASSIDEIKRVRDKVLTDNGFSVAR